MRLLARRLARSPQAGSWPGRRCLATTTGTPTGEDDRDKARPGQHKTPITDFLWSLRDKVKRQHAEEAAKQHDRQLRLSGAAQTKLASRPPTWTEVQYPFSTDVSLRERYLNAFGTIRVGRVVEDLDALAGNIAYMHCAGPQDAAADEGAGPADSLLLVTASIDRIVLGHRANLKDDITLSGRVSWVGNSSMEIAMSACSSWTKQPWLQALFTFVARDRETGRAAPINPLAPASEDEKLMFALGQRRADQRKALRKEKSAATMGREQVEHMIRLGKAGSPEETSVSIEQAAQALYAESAPRLLIPALGLKGAVRMSDTELSNTKLMQPQEKNTAGRIFGGFLVRMAFELAFSTAYLFTGVVPRFREVDEVVFSRPVDVGDLVHFRSRVLFTSEHLHHNPSVHVEVLAHVINPESANTAVSNSFNFSFEVPRGTDLAKVIPETLEDAHNIVTRYYRDLQQKMEDQEGGAGDPRPA